MSEPIGFIGIGNMGTPMATRLVKAGYPVIAHDLSEAAQGRAHDLGAIVAPSPMEVARRCPTVITMLPDSTAVETATLGPDGLMDGSQAGHVLIDMSTSHPSSTIALGRRLAESGVRMLDAPVSGGVAGAKAGTLSVMVGGDADLFERYRPVLSAMGPKVFHIGPAGSGHAMKAINNFLSATTMAATSEAVVLAMKAGIAPEVAIDVLNASTGRSYSTEYKFPTFVLNGAFNSGFSIGLLHKDLDILMRLAREKQVPMMLASTLQQLYTYAMSQGWQDRCHTAIVNYLEDWCGVQARKTTGGDRVEKAE